MKRTVLVLMAVCLLAGFTYAQSNEVTSVNIVGYVKVDIPTNNGYVMVGLNFDSLGTNVAFTAKELFGTNQLRKGAVAGNCDRVYIYDPYKAGGAGYISIWQKANGDFGIIGPGTVTNPVIRTGDGMWLQGANGSSTINTITLMGAVPLDAAIGVDFPVGYAQFSNPFSSDLDINGTNINWTAAGATANNISGNADQIYIYNGGAYIPCYLRLSDLKWHYIGGTGALVTNGVIKVGQGAWYKAKVVYTNNFLKPYNP